MLTSSSHARALSIAAGSTATPHRRALSSAITCQPSTLVSPACPGSYRHPLPALPARSMNRTAFPIGVSSASSRDSAYASHSAIVAMPCVYIVPPPRRSPSFPCCATSHATPRRTASEYSVSRPATP